MLQFVVHYQPPQIPKLLQSYLYRYLWCLSQKSRVSTFSFHIGQLGFPSVNHRLMIKVSGFRAKTKKKICEKPFGIKVKRIIINSKWLLVSGSHEINSGFHGIHSECTGSVWSRNPRRDLGQSVKYSKMQFACSCYILTI